MKLVLKTSTFIFLALLMVFTGKYINASVAEKVRIAQILEEAHESLESFANAYDANKKNVVVIGTSTSLYSFAENSNTPQKFSYADILKREANVLNLASIDLHYSAQSDALIAFARENLPKNEQIVLENLNFVEPFSVFEQETELKELAACFSGLRRSSEFEKKQCKAIFKEFREDNFVWFINPCLKKHHESLSLAFELNSKERIKILTEVMKCNEGPFKNDIVPLELMDLFHFGHFEDLKEAFKVTGHDFSEFKEEDYSDSFSALETMVINRYFNKIKDENKNLHFIIAPTPAKGVSGFSKLPAINNNERQFVLIEIMDEINQMRKLKNLSFYDVFPDGAHARVWAHEILADKIIPELSVSNVEN